MLRVGLTGGLGSGKSTVAAMLRAFGAHVIEADALGRNLMEPGQPVYHQIVRVFGTDVVDPDGRLNRARLADLAFNQGRLQDLNAIVHPAVITEQKHWMEAVFARDSAAVAVVESALVFEVERDAIARGEQQSVLADWRHRFDRILLLTAPDDVKIERYVARTGAACGEAGAPLAAPGWDAARADARVRLSKQMPDREKAERADFVIDNTVGLESLRDQVAAVWEILREESNNQTATIELP